MKYLQLNFFPAFLLLSMLPCGCIASRNPPTLPANEVAKELPLLWSEQEEQYQQTQNVNEPEVFQQEAGVGIENGIIAVVNDRVLTLKEFDYEFYNAIEQGHFGRDQENIYSIVLDMIIDRMLILELAVQKEMSVTDDEVEKALQHEVSNFPGGWEAFRRMLEKRGMSLEDQKDKIKDERLISLVMREIYAGLISPSPSDVLKEYRTRKHEFTEAEKRDLSLILILKSEYGTNITKAKQAGQRIKKRITADNFAQIAKETSDGPKASEGGAQGWVKRKDLAEPISKAGFDLSKGEVSEVQEMEPAFFIVRCNDIQEKQVKAFKDVQTALSRELIHKMQQGRKSKALAFIKQNAYIRKLPKDLYIKYRQTTNQ
ncbi:MAG: peptidyl-prolyl cis-trans isomerase [Planctomycetes bacterium]|nr:peptidyl-prolyl cis-trans isomerase [Planctomycetota bacterium]